MWEYIVQLYAHKSLSSSQPREICLSVGVMNRSATVTSFTITQAAVYAGGVGVVITTNRHVT